MYEIIRDELIPKKRDETFSANRSGHTTLIMEITDLLNHEIFDDHIFYNGYDKLHCMIEDINNKITAWTWKDDTPNIIA